MLTGCPVQWRRQQGADGEAKFRVSFMFRSEGGSESCQAEVSPSPWPSSLPSGLGVWPSNPANEEAGPQTLV